MNYYIQGNKEKADQIKTAFEQLGYDISWPEGCANPDVINIGVERNGAKYVVAETAAYIRDIIKTHPDYKELELPVEPKFKVGDSLQSGSDFTKILSINLEEGRYYCDNRIISFENQDLWHLVPKPHYNIANFKPFDKVLERNYDTDSWTADLFSHYVDDEDGKAFVTICSYRNQCIPFEGNEHLLGTTDMPDEMYINW